MYQLNSRPDSYAVQDTTKLQRDLIRSLARRLDGIDIADEWIPEEPTQASRLIRALQKRLERKRRLGVRSSLADFYE